MSDTDSYRRTLKDMLRDPRPIAGGDGTEGGDEEKPKPGDEKPGGNEPGKGGEEKDYQAEADKWKALARKHEAQAKANADAAKKLQDLEDADKTEVQKAAAKAADAEKRAADAEQRALRLEVAGEKGLTPAQAKRLVGTTKEELEADADELLESFKPSGDDKGKAPSGNRTERLKGGGDPTEEPDEMDPRKLAESVSRSGF